MGNVNEKIDNDFSKMTNATTELQEKMESFEQTLDRNHKMEERIARLESTVNKTVCSSFEKKIISF